MKSTFYPLVGIFLIFLSCHPQETTEDLVINKEKLSITADTLSEHNKKLNYSIEISYPKVNNDSWDYLQKHAMEFFIQNKSDFTTFIKDFSKRNKRTLNGSYEILYQDDQLLSMLLKAEWAVPGTSRILHYSQPVNWNLKKGLPLSGNDYFIKKDSIPKILALAKTKIPENCGTDIEDFDIDFTFSKKGIHLKKLYLSNPPECYGIHLLLEWYEMEELLTENGKKFLTKEG